MLDKMEYIPMVLIGFLFIADEHVNKKLHSITWNIIFMLGVLLLFMVLVQKMECNRHHAIILCMLIWIMLIYIKRCKLK